MNKYAVGVDLGATKISAGVISSNGKVISFLKTSTGKIKTPEYVISRIVKIVRNVIKKSKINPKWILGIGIGSPGPLNAEKGIIYFAPNLKNWKNVHLKDILKNKLRMQVFVDNDANLFALGEAWLGSGKDANGFMAITLGSGVGGGLIMDGKIHHGKNYAAGEIGHIVVKPDGAKCGCGKYGCLEAYSSGSGIVNRLKEAILKGERSILKGEKNITSLKIYKSALKGDKLCRNILNDAGKYLGIAIANVLNLLNLETVAIGGSVAAAWNLFSKPMFEAIKENTLYPAKRAKVVRAKLKDAGVIGAAKLVFLKFSGK